MFIVRVPEAIATSITITSPPQRREDVPVKLFFVVPDLAVARERAVALGGELNPASREWEFQGYRVCDGVDPEGNVVQLRQSGSGGASVRRALLDGMK